MEPWRAALARSEVDAAWDLFIARYRRLILATIRRLIQSDEDVFDAFADVCQALSADGLARLRRYDERADSRARFSTWIVVVVRNRTVDWLRRRSGRTRLTPPDGLSALQIEIFRCVFVERRSHAEAYELLQGSAASGLTFGAFLRELAEVYRAAEDGAGRGVLRYLPPPPELQREPPARPEAALVAAEAAARLAEALEPLPADTRLAVQLFVVEGLPAADVARAVGWPNAKAVYNRVYRALSALREALERQGVGRGDL